MDLIVRGKYVITDANDRESSILTDSAIYISDGIIKEVSTYKFLKSKYPDVMIKGNGRQLLMPGLIDAHTHGMGLSGIQSGVSYDYLENALFGWSYAMDIDPELNTLLSAVRHIRSGCTTVHHNNWGEGPRMHEKSIKTIEAYNKIGMRVSYSPGVRTKNKLALDDKAFYKTLPPDLQAFAKPLVFSDPREVEARFFESFESLYQRYNNSDTRIIFGPSWATGSDDAFLERIKKRSDELGKLPIHIHALQSKIQKAFALKTWGKSTVAHYDDIGLLDESLVLGHAVYITEADIELLASKRAQTTNQPSCNLGMRNGISPVYYLNKAGVNVAVGLDDKGINDDEDIIMELRMIHHLNRIGHWSDENLSDETALSAFDVLKMGTTNAARSCGFHGETGALKVGMKADAILVDLDEILNAPFCSNNLNIAEIFIHRAKGTDVNTVIIAGKVVMEDRIITNIDTDTLFGEIREIATRGISKEQKYFADQCQRIKPYYHNWYKDWIKDLSFEPFYTMNSKI